MIVVEIKLYGSNSDRESNLGLMIIDQINMSEDEKIGDYRCRMYRKGTKLTKNHMSKGWRFDGKSSNKPIREAQVLGHKRLAEPVQNLVAKALKALGYE